MIVAAIISGTVCLLLLWTAFLEDRYEDAVSPDHTIRAGVALVGGWLTIILTATILIAVVAA